PFGSEGDTILVACCVNFGAVRDGVRSFLLGRWCGAGRGGVEGDVTGPGSKRDCSRHFQHSATHVGGPCFTLLLSSLRSHESEQVVVDESGSFDGRPTFEVRILPSVVSLLLVPLPVCASVLGVGYPAAQCEANRLGAHRRMSFSHPQNLLECCNVALSFRT